MDLITTKIYFREREKPFKGFLYTYITDSRFDKKSAKLIINQLKKSPLVSNIQYVKEKYNLVNRISISVRTEEDNAAFLLFAHNGIPVTCYEFCGW
jgi:hypothetical protein